MQPMTDSEWFARNPHRLIRRRLIDRDPEAWALIPRGASEPTIIAGPLGAVDDTDSGLLTVFLEMLQGGGRATSEQAQAIGLLLGDAHDD